MKARSKKNKRPPTGSRKIIIPLCDKVQLFGIPLLAISISIWILITVHVTRQKRSINRVIEKWQSRYALTEEQARKLHEIEVSFHGNGNPFIFSSPPSRKEVYQHHVIMSKVVDQQKAQGFLEDLEGSGNQHQR